MIFGMAAAMGWTVHEAKAATMWEFFAAWHGFVDANTPKETGKLTDTQAEELFAWIGDGDETKGLLSTETYWLEGERLVPAGRVTFGLS